MYGNTRWMYRPVLWFKYSVYRPLRKRLCRHDWEETGSWARGLTFSHTVWYCPKCEHDAVFPMGPKTTEFFFGENGFMRNITLVDGDCLNLVKKVL